LDISKQDPKENFVMEPTITVYAAATIPDTLMPRRRAAATLPAARVRPLRPPAPVRRALGLFRRAQPTTFHRFLAVHMHFAQYPSALD
jgi:hypothetical protein